MKVVALIGDAGDSCVRMAARLGVCTAVAIAPDSQAVSLALGRAKSSGAARLVHLWDSSLLLELEREVLGGELAKAALLAALGRRLEARLFVVPESTHGWLGPALAEELDLPHLSSVISSERVSESGEKSDVPPGLLVRRRCLHGVQRLRGPAAGVLCVLPSPNAPRPSSSSTNDIERWDLARLGLGAADLPRPLLRPVLPERRSELPGRTFDSLSALVERLRQDGLALVPDGGGD